MTDPSTRQAAAKARRLLSRSDEEILDEIDDSVPYRMGWPRPLPVAPVKTVPILDEGRYVSDFGEVKKKIWTILDAARVPCMFSPFLAFRSIESCEPTEDDITIVIESSKTQSHWGRPLMEIRKFLSKRGLDFSIEIIDSNLAHRGSLTVLPSDPIVSSWEEDFRPRVLSNVWPTNWQSINVLHRGTSDDRADCPITLVISAWDSHNVDMWQSVMSQISTFWEHEIELLSAENLETMDLDLLRTGSTFTSDAFAGPLQMGASIGLKSEQSAGTCGGFFILKWPDGRESELGITNHHVVLNDRLKSGEPFNKPAAFSKGQGTDLDISDRNFWRKSIHLV